MAHINAELTVTGFGKGPRRWPRHWLDADGGW